MSRLRQGTILHPRTALVAAIVAVALAVCAGCGGEADDGQTKQTTPAATAAVQASPSSDVWDGLMDQTRALQDENDALEAEASGALSKLQPLNSGNVTAKTVAAALKAMKRGRAITGKAEENFASLATLWDEMGDLNVSEAHSVYAGQQERIARLDTRTAVLLGKFFATFQRMLIRWRTISQSDAMRLGKQANGYMQKGTDLQAQIDGLKEESQQYYEQNVAD